MSEPTSEEIQQASRRIGSLIYRTPVLQSTTLNKLCKASLFFKCENFQKTCSFKIRGAANKILQLDQGISAVTAYSSGNHGQAIAYIAHTLGLKSYVAMWHGINNMKKQSIRNYGGQVIETGPVVAEMEEVSRGIARERNAVFIDPHDDWKVITGAATCAMEFYEDCKDLDYIVMPIGGGGLCSGTCLSTHYFSPTTKVIGVEPQLARDAKDSLEKGSVQPAYPPLTLAEGLRSTIGEMTFSVMNKYISDIILVSEEEMVEAAILYFERMKMVVELSCAVALAAVVKDERFRGKRVGVVVTGGNMDLSGYLRGMLNKKPQ